MPLNRLQWQLMALDCSRWTSVELARAT